MLELPETTTLARQISECLIGKTITAVVPAASPHKFAWYHGDPAAYPALLLDNKILSARGLGMFVEIRLSNATLSFSDGTNLRFHTTAGTVPKKHQLLLEFDDGSCFSVSISMYGGIYCWEKDASFDNSYYNIANSKPSPLKEAFNQTYFLQLLSPETVQKLPLKGALATEQRIPGLGNGCLQDILWQAKLHPKRKMHTLSDPENNQLFNSLKHTLSEMTRLGGRSTEKDLFGKPGGYPVVMCSTNNHKPCPQCGSTIQKDSFMGGSIYTCSQCQPLN